jgi:hypothetical protein
MLDERGIGSGAHLSLQRRLGLLSDPPRPSGSRCGHHPTGLLAPPSPPRDGAKPDAEKAGRLGLGQASVDGAQEPFAEVGRVLLHHLSLAEDQLLRKPL